MPSYVVRFGAMRFLGVFSTAGGREYRRMQRVIARTDRGLEAAEVLCEATDEAKAHLQDPCEGQILRAMTSDDQIEESRIRQQADRELEVCREHVARLALDMKLIDVERIFGGERVVVYYLAENRVDFRELVKTLAGEFQTRIEMRQIGVRDEAKLLADYGDCGQPVCCNTHLVQMPPVSMKMAKVQKATLDPTKISGRCGRLKCCLRYEFDTYEQMMREMPPPGAAVDTPEGRGRVVGQDILAGMVQVALEDQRTLAVPYQSVKRAARREESDNDERAAKPERTMREEPPAERGGEARQPGGEARPRADGRQRGDGRRRRQRGEEPTGGPEGEPNKQS